VIYGALGSTEVTINPIEGVNGWDKEALPNWNPPYDDGTVQKSAFATENIRSWGPFAVPFMSPSTMPVRVESILNAPLTRIVVLGLSRSQHEFYEPGTRLDGKEATRTIAVFKARAPAQFEEVGPCTCGIVTG
jgi:hypothetical protein